MRGLLGSFRALVLLLVCLGAQRNVDANPAGEPDMTELIVSLLKPLQANDPWAGWATGTRVVVKHDVIDGRAHPDLLYVVEAKDERLACFQIVDGKDVRQSFPISFAPERYAGIPRGSNPGTGEPRELLIDGVAVPAMFFEDRLERWTVDKAGRHGTGGSTTRSWVLHGHPSILLRQERDGDHLWAVTSLRQDRQIGLQHHRCVEITTRNLSPDGTTLVTTECLTAVVPGHVVDQVLSKLPKKATPTAKPSIIDHWRVASVVVPGVR